ncbi:hypothetical protein [Sphingomonas sp. 3-13AW]|uniref:hypothetical protein n=1 Tax=Sphingomonas sp. 3-13AW TaxID=3050450 RepID=UPI003BB69A62
MTLDVGTGPVSLIELKENSEHVMLRIVHNAAFDAVKSIDPVAAKAYVAGIRGARYMQDTVAPQHDLRLSDEISKWVAKWGVRVHRIRWDEGRRGVVLATPADLEQYDAAMAGIAPALAPRRSQRIMA